MAGGCLSRAKDPRNVVFPSTVTSAQVRLPAVHTAGFSRKMTVSALSRDNGTMDYALALNSSLRASGQIFPGERFMPTSPGHYPVRIEVMLHWLADNWIALATALLSVIALVRSRSSPRSSAGYDPWRS